MNELRAIRPYCSRQVGPMMDELLEGEICPSAKQALLLKIAECLQDDICILDGLVRSLEEANLEPALLSEILNQATGQRRCLEDLAGALHEGRGWEADDAETRRLLQIRDDVDHGGRIAGSILDGLDRANGIAS